jgi:hypothetical protein
MDFYKTIRIKKSMFWFLLGTFSPILTLIIKPNGYGLYILNHSIPNTLTGQVQMIISESILIIGFIISLITSLLLFKQGIKKKSLLFLVPVLVFVNPLQQMIYLEPLDTYLNNQWNAKAKRLKITDMTSEQIVKIFGNPDNIRSLGLGNRTLEYKPLPGYWMGSHFQIFLNNKKVTGYEANDD